MPAKHSMDAKSAEAVGALLKAARTEGIIAGLEMADKFLALCKDKKDAVAMIKAAILSVRN